MSGARTRRSVGPLRWTWQSTCSTACWSWDARTTSAWPNPGPGWGHCARIPDPCNTAIIDVGAGPASFAAELAASGGHVVACDPLYAREAGEIRRATVGAEEAVRALLAT